MFFANLACRALAHRASTALTSSREPYENTEETGRPQAEAFAASVAGTVLACISPSPLTASESGRLNISDRHRGNQRRNSTVRRSKPLICLTMFLVCREIL